MDWDDLRFYLALTRHRTMASAAKHLNVTQSTVSRRIAALQEGMGVQLLSRTMDGYVLTAAGESIRGHVERVESETRTLEQAIGGYDSRLEGRVIVVASPFVTNQLLLPSFAALHETHPGIVIEVLSDSPDEQLIAQYADIELRMVEFEHPEAIVQKLGAVPFGLYSCVAYLAKHGVPNLSDGCAGHRLIGETEDRTGSPQAKWLTEHAHNGHVVLRTNSYEAQYNAVLFGSGLAMLPRLYAAGKPELHRIGVDVPIPPADLWLGSRQSSRLLPRVRLVLDCIADSVRAKLRVAAVEGGLVSSA